MSNRAQLSLVLHNHQPVGNFPEVFEAAYRQSYLPMLEALHRHPAIRAGLHYSGPLLDWLESAHPEFFPRLVELVDRSQVELLTGGYYEPILAVIPDRDKQGQIRKMTGYLRRRFDVRAAGLWLAERIWEPHLPKALVEAGVEYTIVDDTHFIAVGLREHDLTGHFMTEEEGRTLAIFPSLRRLRYLIPWQPVDEVVAYLRSRASDREPLLLMGDDGEKFGLWPGTYAHCWDQGWMEGFLAALEAEASWLHTVTPAEALQRPATGRVYLPAASYDEMMEWALPAERSAEFSQLRHQRDAGRDPSVAYLRGGFWRHFLVKYPEINTMHKRMLRVSERVWRMPAGSRRQRAMDELWQGQCNCPYWHGVFGGIYLPHIRRATFGHLIAAEALADGPHAGVRAAPGDFDGDGAEEVELVSPAMVVLIDPAEGGGVVEWHWRAAQINLVNVIARRPEAYHVQLQTAHPPAAGAGVETIHTTRVRVKEPGLAQLLVYDDYRKASFLDHVLGEDVTPEMFWRGARSSIVALATCAYAAALSRGPGSVSAVLRCEGETRGAETAGRAEVEKQMTVEGARLSARYRVTNTGRVPLVFAFAVETNWAITDPAAVVQLNGDRYSVSDVHEVPGVERAALRDAGWPEAVELAMPAARVWLLPLWTVSNSEAGFERIFQGVTCVAAWPLRLNPQASWSGTLTVTLP